MDDQCLSRVRLRLIKLRNDWLQNIRSLKGQTVSGNRWAGGLYFSYQVRFFSPKSVCLSLNFGLDYWKF